MSSRASAINRNSISEFTKKARIYGRWRLMGLTFYGDESGSHGEGAYVLSGYLGEDSVWDNIGEQWLEALRHKGKPIEYFHMRECFLRDHQFKEFEQHEAERKLNYLIDIVAPVLRTGALQEFTAILNWDVYETAVSGITRTVYSNPYLLLLNAILTETTKRAVGQQSTDPIWFWFDDQTAKLEYNAAQQFVRLKHIFPPERAKMLHGCDFRDDRFCDQLQIADLIAWQRHHREVCPADEQKAWKRLHNAAEGYIFRFRKDRLLERIQAIDSKLRAQGLL